MLISDLILGLGSADSDPRNVWTFQLEPTRPTLTPPVAAGQTPSSLRLWRPQRSASFQQRLREGYRVEKKEEHTCSLPLNPKKIRTANHSLSEETRLTFTKNPAKVSLRGFKAYNNRKYNNTTCRFSILYLPSGYRQFSKELHQDI